VRAIQTARYIRICGTPFDVHPIVPAPSAYASAYACLMAYASAYACFVAYASAYTCLMAYASTYACFMAYASAYACLVFFAENGRQVGTERIVSSKVQ